MWYCTVLRAFVCLFLNKQNNHIWQLRGSGIPMPEFCLYLKRLTFEALTLVCAYWAVKDGYGCRDRICSFQPSLAFRSGQIRSSDSNSPILLEWVGGGAYAEGLKCPESSEEVPRDCRNLRKKKSVRSDKISCPLHDLCMKIYQPLQDSMIPRSWSSAQNFNLSVHGKSWKGQLSMTFSECRIFPSLREKFWMDCIECYCSFWVQKFAFSECKISIFECRISPFSACRICIFWPRNFHFQARNSGGSDICCVSRQRVDQTMFHWINPTCLHHYLLQHCAAFSWCTLITRPHPPPHHHHVHVFSVGSCSIFFGLILVL